MLPRSEIQNVSYRLRQQQLERLSYDQQDPLTGVEPTVDVLQEGIQAFRLRFYANGRWQERWDSTQSLPQGLEVTLTLDGYGDITRLFLITPGVSQ
jgi:general secretion pathway protein J